MSRRRAPYIELGEIPTLKQAYEERRFTPRNIKRAAKFTRKYEHNEEFNQKISLIQTDITKLKIDAIVNAANETLLGGGGVDGAIHRAAGPELRNECWDLNGCNTGDAKITRGYDLPSKHVIHTVGPVGEKPHLLRSAYERSMQVMCDNNLKSIAFSNISTGVYGYPRLSAGHVALDTMRTWLEKNSDYLDKLDRIIFCVFEDENKDVYEVLFPLYFPPPFDINNNEKEEEGIGQSTLTSLTSKSKVNEDEKDDKEKDDKDKEKEDDKEKVDKDKEKEDDKEKVDKDKEKDDKDKEKDDKDKEKEDGKEKVDKDKEKEDDNDKDKEKVDNDKIKDDKEREDKEKEDGIKDEGMKNDKVKDDKVKDDKVKDDKVKDDKVKDDKDKDNKVKDDKDKEKPLTTEQGNDREYTESNEKGNEKVEPKHDTIMLTEQSGESQDNTVVAEMEIAENIDQDVVMSEVDENESKVDNENEILTIQQENDSMDTDEDKEVINTTETIGATDSTTTTDAAAATDSTATTNTYQPTDAMQMQVDNENEINKSTLKDGQKDPTKKDIDQMEVDDKINEVTLMDDQKDSTKKDNDQEAPTKDDDGQNVDTNQKDFTKDDGQEDSTKDDDQEVPQTNVPNNDDNASSLKENSSKI